MDWQALGARIGPYLTAAIGAAIIACVLFVVRLRRTARSTAFGYVREQAVKNARRIAVLIAVLGLLGALSAALWVVSVRNPALLPTPVPTATPTVIPSPTPRTPTATFTPTSTPTPTPVHTSTPIPPSSEMPGLLQTPFPSHAVAPGPGAALVDVVLASGQVDNQPLNPTNRFPSGTAQVYAFLTFDGMSANVPWAHVWYGEVDGQMVEVWGVVEMWSYASARGQVWRYLNARDGRYELHVYVDRQLQQKVPFTVGGE